MSVGDFWLPFSKQNADYALFSMMQQHRANNYRQVENLGEYVSIIETHLNVNSFERAFCGKRPSKIQIQWTFAKKKKKKKQKKWRFALTRFDSQLRFEKNILSNSHISNLIVKFRGNRNPMDTSNARSRYLLEAICKLH